VRSKFLSSPFDIAGKGFALVNDLAKMIAELENDNIVSITGRIPILERSVVPREK
jgi:hypothetical protein